MPNGISCFSCCCCSAGEGCYLPVARVALKGIQCDAIAYLRPDAINLFLCCSISAGEGCHLPVAWVAFEQTQVISQDTHPLQAIHVLKSPKELLCISPALAKPVNKQTCYNFLVHFKLLQQMLPAFMSVVLSHTKTQIRPTVSHICFSKQSCICVCFALAFSNTKQVSSQSHLLLCVTHGQLLRCTSTEELLATLHTQST